MIQMNSDQLWPLEKRKNSHEKDHKHTDAKGRL